MRMLTLAPYQMPAREDKKKSKRAEGGLRSKGVLDTMSGKTEALSPEDEDKGEEEERDIPPLTGRKEPPLKTWRWRHPREGKYPCQMVRVRRTMLT